MDTTTNPSTETPPRFKTVDEIADVMPYYEESTAVDQAVHRALALMETFASATPTTTNNNSNNNDDDDNPWSDPDRMFAQLDEARHEMAQAWDTLHAATKVEYDPLFDDVVDTTTTVDADAGVDADNTATVDTSSMDDDQDENKTKTAQDQSLLQEEQQIIRMAHMDMITDAFGDVLEDLRKRQESGDDKNDPMDMDTLVDCLQSGLDLVFQNNRMLSNPRATDFQFVDATTTTTAATTTATTSSRKESDDEQQVNLTPHERRRRQLGYLLVDQL